MKNKSPIIFLQDILDSIQQIEIYITDLDFEDFASQRLIVDAVVRNLEIIGEAAKNLPEDFRQQHQDIPWKNMIGLRNIVIHEYFGIDMSIIWEIITKDLLSIKPTIQNLVMSVQTSPKMV